jgi:hypothetical protein
MKKKHDILVEYSTYSRTVLADLKSLSELIRKYSATQQTIALKVPPGSPLKLEQIQNSLLNPQNALKPSMAAFATLLKLEQDIIKSQESIQTQREEMRESIREMREKHVMAQDEKEKTALMEASKEMETLLQKTGDIYQSLARAQSGLDAHYKKVDELALKHDKEWHEYRTFYLQQTLDDILATDIELTESEQKTLLHEDTWPQLILDFDSLNIEIPDYLNIDSPNFETYFRLKAYIAIHSSLSRRMLPHKAQDILKYLKQVLKK